MRLRLEENAFISKGLVIRRVFALRELNLASGFTLPRSLKVVDLYYLEKARKKSD